MPKLPKPPTPSVEGSDMQGLQRIKAHQNQCERIPLATRKKVAEHLTAAFRMLEDAGYGTPALPSEHARSSNGRHTNGRAGTR